jgi:hypothetical protein
MPRKFIRRYMPDVDKVRQVPALAMFGDTLFHPALWHLHRRSAAGGVAVGLFCGLIPGPLQMLGAALVCIVLRVNLPLALLTTLYTNPLTIVPLYLVGYQIGAFVLGATMQRAVAPPPDWDWARTAESMRSMFDWMVGLGTPLVLGVFLLACLLATAGYLAVRGIWSLYLRHAWHSRKRRRAAGAR